MDPLPPQQQPAPPGPNSESLSDVLSRQAKVALTRLPNAQVRKQQTRSRVSHACEPCRRRKCKCDALQPTCSRCDELGITCRYTENRRELTRRKANTMEAKTLLYEAALKEILIIGTEQVQQIIVDVFSKAERIDEDQSPQPFDSPSQSERRGSMTDADQVRNPSMDEESVSTHAEAPATSRMEINDLLNTPVVGGPGKLPL